MCGSNYFLVVTIPQEKLPKSFKVKYTVNLHISNQTFAEVPPFHSTMKHFTKLWIFVLLPTAVFCCLGRSLIQLGGSNGGSKTLFEDWSQKLQNDYKPGENILISKTYLHVLSMENQQTNKMSCDICFNLI